jgi:fructose-1-phosphate kinase PfkB-like protein
MLIATPNLSLDITVRLASLQAGSLPPGVPDDGYRQLVDIGHRAGVPAVVGAIPAVLREALRSRPDLMSPNLSEAEGLLFDRVDEQVGGEGEEVAERAVQAAGRQHAAGAGRAVVTAGAAGAALCTAQGAWWRAAPPVEVVNPIGAGDCFAAGARLAIISRTGDVDIVRRGLAAGSASCDSATAGRFDPGRAEQLFQLIRPDRIENRQVA